MWGCGDLLLADIMLCIFKHKLDCNVFRFNNNLITVLLYGFVVCLTIVLTAFDVNNMK